MLDQSWLCRWWGVSKSCILFFLVLACTCAKGSEPRIAVLLPETGRYAAYGRLQEQGYKLAETHVIRKSKIRVRYFDLGERRGDDLRRFFKDTVLAWNPDLLIGPYGSGRAVELVGLVKDGDTPLIIPTAMLDSLTTDAGNPNVFRLAAPAGLLSDAAMGFIKAQMAGGTVDEIRVLAEDSTFSRGVVETLKISALKHGLNAPKTVFYPPGFLDSERGRLEISEKTALLAITRSVGDCRTITEDFAGRSLLIGLSAGFSTRDYRVYLKKTKWRPVVVSPWNNDPSIPAVSEFIGDFSSTYSDAFTKAVPQYHSAQAYSAMVVAEGALASVSASVDLGTALRRCEVVTPMGTVSFVDYEGYYRQSVIPPVVQRFTGEAFATLSSMETATHDKASENDRPSFVKVMLNNQLMALFVILAVGLSLGRIQVWGLSFGTAGVLFAALVVGHFHLTIPSGVGSFGLVLFIYCVGVSAGPNFFKSFASQGMRLAKLSIITVSVGAAMTAVLIIGLDVPLDLAIGLFAGALTSTPALAAGIDALKDFGDLVPVGYGIAYPFGVVGVVVFVQLVPRFFGKDLDSLDAGAHEGETRNRIRRRVVRISNAAVIGKPLGKLEFLTHGDCVASRMIVDGVSVPVKYDLVLTDGMQLLLIGNRETLDVTAQLLGETVKTNYVLDIEQQQMKVVVTSKNTIGKRMKELDTLKHFGVVISRVARYSVEFVPDGKTVVEEYDVLTAVGEKKDLEAFAEFAGHKARALEQTDVFKVCLAIILGIMVGKFPIVMPNGKMISLGLAGGPLFVALVLSHFRKVGYIPPASRSLMQKLGLMLFLANAGVEAGDRLLPTIQQHGVSLFLMGIALTLVPMMVTFTIAHFALKMGFLDMLGGVCGSMTSTPALGAITAKTDALQPVTSYAVAYPVALIFMTVAVQILASIFL